MSKKNQSPLKFSAKVQLHKIRIYENSQSANFTEFEPRYLISRFRTKACAIPEVLFKNEPMYLHASSKSELWDLIAGSIQKFLDIYDNGIYIPENIDPGNNCYYMNSKSHHVELLFTLFWDDYSDMVFIPHSSKFLSSYFDNRFIPVSNVLGYIQEEEMIKVAVKSDNCKIKTFKTFSSEARLFPRLYNFMRAKDEISLMFPRLNTAEAQVEAQVEAQEETQEETQEEAIHNPQEKHFPIIDYSRVVMITDVSSDYLCYDVSPPPEKCKLLKVTFDIPLGNKLHAELCIVHISLLPKIFSSFEQTLTLS